MLFNAQQIKAIEKGDGNTVVIATAGSGKTAVIVNRIERLISECGVSPENILAVTFSKKAKENIQNRLQGKCDGVNIETFHSVALKIVQGYSKNRYELWLKQWEKENCLFEICHSMGLCKTKDEMEYNDLMIFISTQKTNMKTPDNPLFDKKYAYSNSVMKEIYKQYEAYKEKNKLIEFDDLLNKACDIFTDNEKALTECQDKFKYILVDEFQDVSINQVLFLKLLTMKNNNLFVVGDGCQAIYKFRGGKSEYLLEFDKNWEDSEAINLYTNYRCSKEIVATANMLASHLPESKNKYYVEAVADRGSIAKPIFIECGSAFDEAQRVSEEIKKLSEQGIKHNDIAVLARTNAQLQLFESKLASNNIQYNVFNDTTFIERPEIKLALMYIRLAHDTNDDEAFSYIYNKPLRWLDKKFLAETTEQALRTHKSLYESMFKISRRDWKFKGGIDEISKIVTTIRKGKYKTIGEELQALREIVEIDKFVSRGKISEEGDAVEQIENLNTFGEICNQFTDFDEFNKYIVNIKENNLQESSERVNLMTIHKSKGLEFPVVFLVGCSEGLLPHRKSNDINDEKRLMYVGITRAMDRLYLTSNNFYNASPMEVSSFIEMLGDTIERSDTNG